MRTAPAFLGIVLVLAGALAPAPAAADAPADAACDDSGLVVCAGVVLDARVDCGDADAHGRVACAWAYGWSTRAASPAALSGTETHAVILTLTTCAGDAPCAMSSHTVRRACAWLPAFACEDAFASEEGAFAAALAPGECLRVEVALRGAIEAKVPDLHLKLAQVRHDAHAEAADEACVDDGR